MNTHAEVVERLSALLEAELPLEESREVEAHLEDCVSCQANLERLRRTTHLLRALEPHAAPPDLEARVRRRVRRRSSKVLPFRPHTWPQELLSAAVLAVIIGATVTLSGRLLAPSVSPENTSSGSTAAGLIGDQMPQAVEVRFASRDEAAARAVVAAAADLGARTASGLPLRPGEPLGDTGMVFTLPREALAVIVPDGIATVMALPASALAGGMGARTLPTPAPGWIVVRVRIDLSEP